MLDNLISKEALRLRNKIYKHLGLMFLCKTRLKVLRNNREIIWEDCFFVPLQICKICPKKESDMDENNFFH